MKKSKDTKKIVAMENSLIPAFALRNKKDKLLLSYCIAQIDSKRDKQIGKMTFQIKDYAEALGLSSVHVYREIRESIDRLNGVSFKRYEKGVHSTDCWIVWSEYIELSGQVTIQLNERLMPLLLDLKEKQYIQFALKDSNKFTPHGWSLYVILKQWLKAGSQEFDLDGLKVLLGIKGKYSSWAVFQRDVIKPATNNINDVSDITVEYAKIKFGRSVTGLFFTINRKGRQPSDIEIPNVTEEIKAVLATCKIHHKTAEKLLKRAIELNKENEFLKKCESLYAKFKSGNPKAVTGSLNSYLHQGDLPFEKPKKAKLDAEEYLSVFRNYEDKVLMNFVSAGNKFAIEIAKERGLI